MSQNSDNTAQVVEHFFRLEYSKVIAGLTARYGVSNIDLVEDAIQDALIKAMDTWPFKEVPKNPSGWIYSVARNNLIDALRRASKVEGSADVDQVRDETEEEDMMEDIDSDIEIQDERLRMMFACCHPSLSIENQIIFFLKFFGERVKCCCELNEGKSDLEEWIRKEKLRRRS